jgi:hypothetical protein
LQGNKESAKSLIYKHETIRVLNEMLKDPTQALADETIAAVLLLGNVLVSTILISSRYIMYLCVLMPEYNRQPL